MRNGKNVNIWCSDVSKEFSASGNEKLYNSPNTLKAIKCVNIYWRWNFLFSASDECEIVEIALSRESSFKAEERGEKEVSEEIENHIKMRRWKHFRARSVCTPEKFYFCSRSQHLKGKSFYSILLRNFIVHLLSDNFLGKHDSSLCHNFSLFWCLP